MHSRGVRQEIHQQTPTADPVQTVLEGLEESLEDGAAGGNQACSSRGRSGNRFQQRCVSKLQDFKKPAHF